MFGKKKQKEQNSGLDFESIDYKMNDRYKSDDLVVANLEYISSEPTPYGPQVIKTKQKYIFEKITDKGKIRYREVFTGFIADSEESHYFNLPYVINILPLKEQCPSVTESIPKYGLLLVLNEVNQQTLTKQRMK